jgi:4-hydroxy-3-polyprenylbenzoate decarboxylase
MRIIIGISGASGVIIGYEVLKALRQVSGCEKHLVITDAAERTFACETDISLDQVRRYADVVHDNKNMAASISSGTFKTDGIIIAPCSMKTVAGIVSGYADNLLLRATDVCIKENRRIVIVPREMPLSRLHLRNIKKATDYGCIIIPPMLTFYNGMDTLQKQIDHIIGKIFMQFEIEYKRFFIWRGQG